MNSSMSRVQSVSKGVLLDELLHQSVAKGELLDVDFLNVKCLYRRHMKMSQTATYCNTLSSVSSISSMSSVSIGALLDVHSKGQLLDVCLYRRIP